MIAIIDDENATCRAVQRLLQSDGLECLAFESAELFLGAGRLSDFSCLILDVRMPGMTGLELQKCLLKADVLIPIIFITGYVNDIVRAGGKAAGTVAILEKPFEKDALMAHVKAAIKVFKRGDERGN